MHAFNRYEDNKTSLIIVYAILMTFPRKIKIYPLLLNKEREKKFFFNTM